MQVLTIGLNAQQVIAAIKNGNLARAVYDLEAGDSCHRCGKIVRGFRPEAAGDSCHRCGKIVPAGHHHGLTPYYTNPDNVQQCGQSRKFVHPDMAYFAERG